MSGNPPKPPRVKLILLCASIWAVGFTMGVLLKHKFQLSQKEHNTRILVVKMADGFFDRALGYGDDNSVRCLHALSAQRTYPDLAEAARMQIARLREHAASKNVLLSPAVIKALLGSEGTAGTQVVEPRAAP